MHCPFCNAVETKVIDSRLFSDGRQVRRRRECATCSERFTSYEIAELVMPRIIKRDGRRKPFDEEKLRGGILRALEKRPVGVDEFEASMERIKSRLRASGEREVESNLIGEWVMDELRSLDQVAYVRFASVYRRFEDLHEFRDEINRLQQQD